MEVLVIPSRVLKEVVSTCKASKTERVYIGVGSKKGSLYTVENVIECPNIAEAPATRFIVDPLCMYHVFSDAEKRGLEVTALIHNHPAPPLPSSEDQKGMVLWPIPWVIISSSTGEYRAWIHVNGEVREVTIVEV